MAIAVKADQRTEPVRSRRTNVFSVPQQIGSSHVNVKRTGIVLKPNNTRVLFRPFEPASQERCLKIIARIMSVDDAEVSRLLADVMREFQGRHQRLQDYLLERFESVRRHLLTDQALSEERRLLIGAILPTSIRWNRPRCLIRRWSGIPTKPDCRQARDVSC